MKPHIIEQGAEALLIKKGNTIIKQRSKKSYRLPQLDEKLRSQRTKKEAKLLEKAAKIILAPRIIKIDENKKEITLEYIKGKVLSKHLDSLSNLEEIGNKIGKSIAKLHDAGIIHGDLTTSNMIFKDNQVYFIDFGLGFESHNTEDKAVDLHVLKEALEAKHYKKASIIFQSVLKGYKSASSQANLIIQRLEKVERRGRYKEQF